MHLFCQLSTKVRFLLRKSYVSAYINRFSKNGLNIKQLQSGSVEIRKLKCSIYEMCLKVFSTKYCTLEQKRQCLETIINNGKNIRPCKQHQKPHPDHAERSKRRGLPLKPLPTTLRLTARKKNFSATTKQGQVHEAAPEGAGRGRRRVQAS